MPELKMNCQTFQKLSSSGSNLRLRPLIENRLTSPTAHPCYSLSIGRPKKRCSTSHYSWSIGRRKKRCSTSNLRLRPLIENRPTSPTAHPYYSWSIGRPKKRCSTSHYSLSIGRPKKRCSTSHYSGASADRRKDALRVITL